MAKGLEGKAGAHAGPLHQGPWEASYAPVMIDGTAIELVSSTKFLGMYIDEHLTWDVHINTIANKIAKNLGVLRRIAYLLPSKILVNLYYTLINPYLVFGNIVWVSNYYYRRLG